MYYNEAGIVVHTPKCEVGVGDRGFEPRTLSKHRVTLTL